MGFAMVQQWRKQNIEIQNIAIHVVEPDADLRARAAQNGAICSASAAELGKNFSPDMVVFAVKPQIIEQVAPDYRQYGEDGHAAAFISIAAGISLAHLSALLPKSAPIIRCMPNLPAAIGVGMLVCCANHQANKEIRDLVDRLLACLGEVAWIDDEQLMDAVTAISGSGPGYLFHFIESLAQAGSKLGLPAKLSAILALRTVAGAAAFAAKSDAPPAVLRDQVTSKGGTTEAGMEILAGVGYGLSDLMEKTAAAACQRSRELGQKSPKNNKK